MGWPVFGQTGCWLLRPYLTDGCRRTPALVFPIMDNKHNAVKELDARQVSDNIQRASVKCIATFTGLGLKLYSGEDIPTSDEKEPPKLPLQQEATKPAARASTKASPVAEHADAPGTTGLPAASSTSEFNGKEALLSFCRANPLGYGEERRSMIAGKTALEALGLSKGDDIKDAAMFANVVTTMVTAWIKEEGLKLTKAQMTSELDVLRKACEVSTEQAIKEVEVFVQGKK